MSGRYPVYVSSDPIWTDIGVLGPVVATGISLPDHMFINRTVQYTTTQTVQIDPLRGEVANHEFFHTVQWTYVPGFQIWNWLTREDLKWWMEATARWAEPKVYPQNGTYPGDLDALLREPYRSMTHPEMGYASAIFARYLEDKVAAPRNPADAHAIIRKTWERYRALGGSSMLTAIDQTLRRPESRRQRERVRL